MSKNSKSKIIRDCKFHPFKAMLVSIMGGAENKFHVRPDKRAGVVYITFRSPIKATVAVSASRIEAETDMHGLCKHLVDVGHAIYARNSNKIATDTKVNVRLYRIVSGEYAVIISEHNDKDAVIVNTIKLIEEIVASGDAHSVISEIVQCKPSSIVEALHAAIQDVSESCADFRFSKSTKYLRSRLLPLFKGSIVEG